MKGFTREPGPVETCRGNRTQSGELTFTRRNRYLMPPPFDTENGKMTMTPTPATETLSRGYQEFAT